MITELEIEGFKSFGSPGQTIRLGKLNFLVGANATGKTNLLSALRFLQLAVMQNVDYAVNEFGGVAEVRNKRLKQRNRPKPVRIRLGFEADNIRFRLDDDTWTIQSYDYEVCLDLRGDDSRPEVQSETLTVKLLLKGKDQTLSIKRNSSSVEIIDPMRSLGDKKRRELQIPKGERSRLVLNVGFFVIPCVILRDLISHWRFYNVSPSVARRTYREEPDTDLGSAGENLSVILHKIEQGDKDRLQAIVNGLRSVVPGFNGIKIKRLDMEGKWAFQIEEEKLKGAINPSSVSDGTIRLLALLVLTNWGGERSELVAVEEPENGLHPHLTEHVVQILRAASESRQVFVTTHNPNFLDFLEPEEVFLCDKIDGFTQIQRASDIAQINEFRKDFQLGELWTQGAIGGVP